ncbi:hypothetical protein [Vreelandella hamiltonii]|uniref:Uncharacterized protein n=1 Tax=Halomonas johnsoniae TaxID=502832 RepID=A0ABQ2WGK4_9GAMM|nr:hypothetical protein [Halomonas johnsoniae]KHJ49886.1 hypothetical protein PZ78_16035 [Halomonas hydrothermalis]GGW50399.1 hypothetical protein GCM10007158_09180 [Halomonas johnsoniae]
MSAQPPVVKQAMQAFRQGNYAAAKVLYQKAAQYYGEHLFKANLYLCDKYAAGGSSSSAAIPEGTALQATQAQRQLHETQQLLEHYYQRCQELDYQRLDR